MKEPENRDLPLVELAQILRSSSEISSACSPNGSKPETNVHAFRPWRILTTIEAGFISPLLTTQAHISNPALRREEKISMASLSNDFPAFGCDLVPGVHVCANKL